MVYMCTCENMNETSEENVQYNKFRNQDLKPKRADSDSFTALYALREGRQQITAFCNWIDSL